MLGVVIYAWPRNQTTETQRRGVRRRPEASTGKERRGRRGRRGGQEGTAAGPAGQVVWEPSDEAPSVGSDGREGDGAGVGLVQTEAQNRPHHRISCPIMCRPVHACSRVKWTHGGADRWGVGPSCCLRIFWGTFFFCPLFVKQCQCFLVFLVHK